MKKRYFLCIIIMIITVSVLSSCVLFELPTSSSGINGADKTEYNTEYAYSLAVNAGYEGSLQDFINDIKGKDGENGSAGEDGKDGEAGKDGTDGKDGRGVLSVSINGEGHLIVTYTDGTSTDAGLVVTDGEIPVITQDNSAKLINEALLATVSVWAEIEEGLYGAGAGVVYSLDKENGDAYIITNHHVVHDADSSSPDGISQNIFIFLYGMERYEEYKIPAVYVGGSMDYDIAVLKVSGSELIKTSEIREVKIADSDGVRAYDTAVAIGNPSSKGLSVTQGIVSVDNEPTTRTGASGRQVTLYMMRIDAAVNEGNSGGGLYNKNGELIGIVSAKEVDVKIDNIGYAIPSNLAVMLADKIIDHCETRGYKYAKKVLLGIQCVTAKTYSEFDSATGKLSKRECIKVDSVVSGALAEGYLQNGDLLVSVTVNGREIKINRTHILVEFAIMINEGDRVVFNIERDGNAMDVEIPISENSLVEIK